MHILLFFTFDVSLKDWSKSGLLSREILLYQKLSETKDIQFTFFTFGDSEDLMIKNLPDNIMILPAYTLISHSSNKILRLLKSLYIPFKLRNTIQEVDIMKTNQLNGSWIGLICKAIYKKPLITRTGYDMYSFAIKEKKSIMKKTFIYLLTQLNLNFANLYLVTSSADKNFLSDKFFNKKNIKIRPNWIKIPTSKKIENRHTERLLAVGRLEYQKNYDYLINALSDSELTLDIVGEGSLKKELKEIASSKNVKINFLGKLNNADLIRLYGEYKFFVSASLYEGNPKAVLEAMSAGCIVLINQTPNVEEIIKNGENGIFFDIKKNDFIKIYKKWSNRSLDLEKISNNAIRSVKDNNSLISIVEEEFSDYKKLYQS